MFSFWKGDGSLYYSLGSMGTSVWAKYQFGHAVDTSIDTVWIHYVAYWI